MPHHQHGLHRSSSNHIKDHIKEAVEDAATEDTLDVLGVADAVPCQHPCHSLADNT